MNCVECEQYNSEQVCCTCHNLAYKQLLDKYNKLLEQKSKLQRGLYNCYTAIFYECPKCSEICTENYICWNCGYDKSMRKDLDNGR